MIYRNIFFLMMFFGFSCKGNQPGKETGPKPQTVKSAEQPADETRNEHGDDKKQTGLKMPLVEPRLDTRPQKLYVVVAAVVDTLGQAEVICRRIGGHPFVPVGYPAVDRADTMFAFKGKWAILVGKYAGIEYAQALHAEMARHGFEGVRVVESVYRHDRHRPNLGSGQGELAGQVFAGMPGVDIPLLSGPDVGTGGRGRLSDGKLVTVLHRMTNESGQLWYRVQSGGQTGYLHSSRLLMDHNVYPAPDGRHAVLGVDLGCADRGCAWDYWLVDRGYKKRKLLASHADRLAHDFCPSGIVLAYHAPGMPLRLISVLDASEVADLGQGTSPVWSADGKVLYFRRPGRLDARDEVMSAVSPGWKVDVVLDFPGEPAYPALLSVYPPRVDILASGNLFTLFYRLEKNGGKKNLQRWKVLFRKDGRVIEKTGEKMTE